MAQQGTINPDNPEEVSKQSAAQQDAKQGQTPKSKAEDQQTSPTQDQQSQPASRPNPHPNQGR